MVCTRPDIAHGVGVVRRYMKNPGKEHSEEVKWILMFLRGTSTHALCFGGSDIVLHGYVDSDMEGVGTREDPGFNASIAHQQNPNYRPFRKHLRSR
jgi:hypothetical protein